MGNGLLEHEEVRAAGSLERRADSGVRIGLLALRTNFRNLRLGAELATIGAGAQQLERLSLGQRLCRPNERQAERQSGNAQETS